MVPILGFVLSATASAANHIVEARSNLTFSPSNLTITAGDTVTFRNAGGSHNAVSDPGAVTAFRCANGCDGTGGNGNVSSASWSATVTFPTVGTVGYYCEAHGAPGGVGMAGRITINPAPAVTSRRSDFNGDGRSDILWRNSTSGATALWLSANSATSQALPVVPTTWRVVGPGDYDGDGRADLLWRNFSSGVNALWLSANSATPQTLPTVPTAWRVVGSGDYDGDGRADILWRNLATGANTIWRSANFTTPQAVTAVANFAWTVVGSGDYNGDGRADVLWRNGSSGANALWLSANSATPQALPTVPLAWRVVGSADYDGDGRDDLLWRNFTTGANVIWRSANPSTPQAVTGVNNFAWEVGTTE